MSWAFAVMVFGICVSFSGFVVFYLFGPRRARVAGPKTTIERSDSLRELCSAIVFGGVVLSQVGINANYILFGTAPRILALSLVGSAFFVWAFGFFSGRLSLYRQLRPKDEAGPGRRSV